MQSSIASVTSQRGGCHPLQLVVETVAREAPDGLLRIPRTHLSQQRQQIPLVLRFKRLTAEDGQPADIGFVELGENLVRRRLREGLAVVEVPRLRLEAAGTVVAAAGDRRASPARRCRWRCRIFSVLRST